MKEGDRLKMSTRSVIALLIALAILMIPADSAFACSEKCKRELDRNFCSDSLGFNAGQNCREWSECMIYAVDADGAGPGSPTIFVTCQYKCAVDYCNWV